MKKISAAALTAFLLAYGSFVFADESSYNSDWGIGIIAPINATPSTLTNFVFLPDNGLKIYEMPSGKKFSILNKKESALFITAQDKTLREINSADLITVGVDGYCLKVYEKTANYVKVLAASKKGGYWISLDDMKTSSYNFFSWMSILQMVKNGLFVNEGQGLNLRTQPSTDGDKIITVKGDRFIINLTGKVQGNWAEANVIELENPPCSGEQKEVNSYTGWMKAIDDKGFPNIWFNITGC